MYNHNYLVYAGWSLRKVYAAVSYVKLSWVKWSKSDEVNPFGVCKKYGKCKTIA